MRCYTVVYTTMAFWSDKNCVNGYGTSLVNVSLRILADDPKEAIEDGEKAVAAFQTKEKGYPHSGSWKLESVTKDTNQ
jgi:hypothetical protein